MSLSARIALQPSRRIAWAERVLAIAGIVVAAAGLVGRWPAWWPGWSIGALVVLGLIAWQAARRARADRERILAVSDRAACDLYTAGDASGEASWRLTETTLFWPGFAVLALARDGSRRTLRLPVVMAEMAVTDRHALGRFLLWSMRDGRGRDPHDDRRRTLA